MQKWLKATAAVAVCGVCFLAGQVFAQEGGGAGDAGGGFPLPEWTKKGPEHESFKKFVGDWDVQTKMWMAPGTEPMQSAAKSTGKLFYDGRFLEQHFEGNMMGAPFTGRLFVGFDRVDNEYVSIWVDSMSTYMSVSRGKDVDGVVTYELNDPDWMTGKKKPTTMVMKWDNDDQYTLSFMDKAPDGKPYMTMQFVYTRKKQ